MDSQNTPRSIVVVGTGGTIAARGTSQKYESGVYSIRELTNGLSLAGRDIRITDYSSGDSINKTDRNHINLTTRVQELLRGEGVGGVVVTHGTDTLPELAVVMSCILHPEKPVVITGAIRPPTEASADGSANLKDAIVVAHQGHKRGCMVVFNQKILSGRHVFKSRINSLNAFSAAKPGQLGLVDAGRVHFFHPIAAQVGPLIRVPSSFQIPRVEIFYCHSSFPPSAVQDGIKRGMKACVFVAFGDGYWAAGREAIASLLSEHNVPSIIVSQANKGIIRKSNAGFGIPGGWLKPTAARALLILCMIKGMGHDKIEVCFREWTGQGYSGTIKPNL